jgi:teichuronic acid biosynthesis glycosyltransferase TuaC
VRRLRIAVVSSFYTNVSAPYRTLFVYHLVTALTHNADVEIVAPIPFAPPWPARPGWRALRRVPYVTRSGSTPVEHPRYIVLPKVPVISGLTYALAVAPALRRAVHQHGINVIHVHCAYPDAVGVALVARTLGVPFVITAHGSDINVYAQQRSLRAQIRWALSHARAVIAVSEDLRSKICALAPRLGERVRCIPCSGVDPTVFRLGERSAARADHSLQPTSRVVLFVGNLVPIKGLDTLVAAWRILLGAGEVGPEDRLIFIGDGPLRARLQQESKTPGLDGTMRLVGPLPQSEIASWMRAASVLCLSSHQEGMPNVVVEALASGLPVVATAVGGIPDIVRPEINGYLAANGDARHLAEALARALTRKWDARQIAATVADYNWAALAARNLDVLSSVVRLEKTR